MAQGYRRPRDHRLDFWRGLCLVDMVLVHLVYERVQFGDFLQQWIGTYTRFAAGGFIFVSGLGVGAIFLPRARQATARVSAYLSLWRRSVYVLGVQFIGALGFILLELFRGIRPPVNNGWLVLRDVLLLREGGDLLPFYVIMLAISPLLLEILRRRGGIWLAALLSIAGFIWGQNHPWAFAIASHQNFPPVLWQSIFVGGLICGVLLPRYDALAQSAKIAAFAVVSIVFALLFVSEYSSDFGFPALNLHLAFTKVPLSAGEALRYLSLVSAIAMATDLLWPLLANSMAAEFVQTLGRKSLPVYVAHVWLVEAVATLAITYWWWGRWQIALAAGSVLMLWALAKLLEALASRKSNPVPQPAWAMQSVTSSDSMAA